MKIALLGYGKMGQFIEKIALERGHQIVLKVDKDTQNYDITQADIAIEFSTPESAFANITNALQHKIPVIAGTTGWLEHYPKTCQICLENKTAFLYASNFSIGVNIFFEVNKLLAKLMANLSQYEVSIEEIHHTQKLDAPSGTAISLAQHIISEGNKTQWALNKNDENSVPIFAIREGEVPGTHTVTYKSLVDTINIKHTAHSREGFAFGAVLAAEWLLGKQGVFSMNDVLFNTKNQ